jgi:DNA-binding LacI/PurR family transcriptional regulator
MKSSPTYVTQQQVAKKAGIHQTTVSLVFRNHPSIPAETREAVLKAARELGYKRHPLLAALMSTRLRLSPSTGSPVLAFLTDFDRGNRWKESPTAVQMFEGAKARARELGFRLEVFWLGDPAVRPARLAEILKARNIHGVLLAPTHQPRGVLTFDFAPFATVGLGVSSETSAMLSVAHDHFGGMHTALQRCADAGWRRVAVVLTMAANEIVRDKWLAAHALYCGPGQPGAHLPVWHAPFDPVKLRAWLRKHRPDAIIGTFDEGFGAWLKSLGYKLPRELALVSLSLPVDDEQHAGIYQRSPTIGARAVDLLIGALNHNESGLLAMRQVLQIEGEWRSGPSLPEVKPVALG